MASAGNHVNMGVYQSDRGMCGTGEHSGDGPILFAWPTQKTILLDSASIKASGGEGVY